MAEFQKNGYVYELLDIRNKLKDFIEHVNKGDVSFIKEIAIKLRLFYSNVNNVEKKTQKSLFKIISNLFNIEISVYTKSTNTLQKLKDKGIPLPKMIINSATATWFETGDKLTEINSAISKEMVYFNGENYSFTELFRNIADKLGGCHIDKYVSDNIIKLYTEQIYIQGNQVLVRNIIDLATASIKLIDMIENFIENNKENTFIRIKTN